MDKILEFNKPPFKKKDCNHKKLKQFYYEKYKSGYENSDYAFYRKRQDINNAYDLLQREHKHLSKKLKEEIQYWLKEGIKKRFDNACYAGSNPSEEDISHVNKLRDTLQPIHEKVQAQLDRLSNISDTNLNKLPDKYNRTKRLCQGFCEVADEEYKHSLQIGLYIVFLRFYLYHKIDIEKQAINDLAVELNDESWPEIKTKGISSDDGRETHGEKEAIQQFWRKNKEKYLVAENTHNGYYNASEIARKVQGDGEFSSSLGTIKDHASLHKYSNKKHSSEETRTKF